MGFIYEETNHYGVEAIVALERYCTPSDEKTCTAATEATRICETYGIPERELLPLVRPLAAAEEYMLEHLTADRDALQFLFTPHGRQHLPGLEPGLGLYPGEGGASL